MYDFDTGIVRYRPWVKIFRAFCRLWLVRGIIVLLPGPQVVGLEGFVPWFLVVGVMSLSFM